MFSHDPHIEIGVTTFDTKTDGVPVDLLNRKDSGLRLSQLIERLTAPTVIALDGGWGSGKSHFLKLWCGAHSADTSHKAHPIYINAFAEDYLDDPLISLVAAINREVAPEQNSASEKALDLVKKNAGKIARLVTRLGIAATVGGLTAIAAPAVDAVLGKVQEHADKSIENLWAAEAGRAEALEGFRVALAELAGQTPLVLIVDELDRCRPDYALTLLEIAKHSFAVPNVHFILGVNLASLEHSVRKRYGAGIDAAEYLQKFYHLRMGLPEDPRPTHRNWRPVFLRACNHLAVPNETMNCATEILEVVCKSRNVSLRDVQRLAARLAVIPVLPLYKGWQFTIVSAAIIEIFDRQLYQKLRADRKEHDAITRFFGLDPQAEPERYAERLLWHIWRFLLHDEPGDQTQQLMSKAFDSWPSARSEIDLQGNLHRHLDLFTIHPT